MGRQTCCGCKASILAGFNIFEFESLERSRIFYHRPAYCFIRGQQVFLISWFWTPWVYNYLRYCLYIIRNEWNIGKRLNTAKDIFGSFLVVVDPKFQTWPEASKLNVLQHYGMTACIKLIWCTSIALLSHGPFWCSHPLIRVDITCKAGVELCCFRNPCWWSATGKFSLMLGRSKTSSVFASGNESDVDQ